MTFDFADPRTDMKPARRGGKARRKYAGFGSLMDRRRPRLHQQAASPKRTSSRTTRARVVPGPPASEAKVFRDACAPNARPRFRLCKSAEGGNRTHRSEE